MHGVAILNSPSREIHFPLPPRAMDFRERARIPELMDAPCSRDIMRACLRDIARVNRWFLAHRPLLQWLESIRPGTTPGPLRILDVGCGYGDGLRRIERWARTRCIPVELTGLDINPDAVAIAAEASHGASRIRWIAADVFEHRPPQPAHLIVSSLFTHHLSDEELVRFLQWMEQNAENGWFVNDLSRAPIPYHLFRWFSRLVRLHPFVQHDGPVSIARAFVPGDWRRLCKVAGVAETEIEILDYQPARLCVSRRKAS